MRAHTLAEALLALPNWDVRIPVTDEWGKPVYSAGISHVIESQGYDRYETAEPVILLESL